MLTVEDIPLNADGELKAFLPNFCLGRVPNANPPEGKNQL